MSKPIKVSLQPVSLPPSHTHFICDSLTFLLFKPYFFKSHPLVTKLIQTQTQNISMLTHLATPHTHILVDMCGNALVGGWAGCTILHSAEGFKQDIFTRGVTTHHGCHRHRYFHTCPSHQTSSTPPHFYGVNSTTTGGNGVEGQLVIFLASTTAIAEVEAEFSAGLCELMSLSQQLLQLQPQVLHDLMHKHTNKTNKNEVVVLSSPKLRAPSPDIPCEEPL